MIDGATVGAMVEAVGFPIVACVALFWLVKTSLAKLNDSVTELNKNVVLNTESIRQLTDKLKG